MRPINIIALMIIVSDVGVNAFFYVFLRKSFLISDIMINPRHILAVLLVAVFPLMFNSCGDGGDEPEPEKKATRTILVYMVASNTLDGCDTDDINEMKQAISQGANGCRVIVYNINLNSGPRLMELVQKNGVVTQEVVKEYDNTLGASVTVARMRQVIQDAKTAAPAEDYGFILWSHSTGWAATRSSVSIRPSDFGDDNGSTMPIPDLARALPENAFSFIYADVCYMGSIEVAYELRKSTRFFVGSPTETLAAGMPYNLTLPYMFKSEADLVGACKATYDYYNAKSGQYQSATVCLIDCSKLEQVASVCKEIAPGEHSVDTSTLQCYNSSANRFYFDFMQYYRMIGTSEQYARLQRAYDECLIYKAATPYFLGSMVIAPENFSGLSTYVLGSSTTQNENAYKRLQWYDKVYIK